MTGFTVRADAVELQGTVFTYWQDQPLSSTPGTRDWHIIVQLASGDPHLVTADGKANALDWIECRVTPISPYRDQPFGGRLMSELIGQSVRIHGTWVDLTNQSGSIGTALWPVAWIVIDRGITPIVEEHGFSQAIRDVDVYAFSDDTALFTGTLPPHHQEDRHFEIRIPFPLRPQPTCGPVFSECADYEDREQVLYGFRVSSSPSFPVHAERQFSYATQSTPEADTLVVSIDTGEPSLGQGFTYVKLTLTYDEPFDKMCFPDVCLTDPTKSCQFTGASRVSYAWPRIATALPGDLLLGPAGGKGVLGRLLGALQGPQFYDHMVMFVEDDGRTVRHCTASDERIAAEEYYTATVSVKTPIFSGSKKLPLLGIRQDIIKYAWPGTINQSLGEVCFSGRNRLNPQFGFAARYLEVVAAEALAGPAPLLREMPPSERDKRTSFHDPEAAGTAKREKDGGKRASYSLVRLQKAPAFRVEIDPSTGKPFGWLYPVLVRPHPFLAGIARDALRSVAKAAKNIVAHYRFFSYSDASISVDPGHNAPMTGWPAREGVDWAAGSVAAVCSSFVWAAVQAANPTLIAAGKPRIELEGEGEPEDARPTGGTDGLYGYSVVEREAAGRALYDFTHDRVTGEIEKAIDDLAWYADLIVEALNVNGSVDDAKNGLANVVANQLCNVFASDAPQDLAGTWKSPGTGAAVSPDDTMLRWDVRAPLTGPPPAISPDRVNVYGQATGIVMPEPGWRVEPIYEVRESAGTGSLSGKVIRRLPGDPGPTPAIGATVRMGCQVRTNQPTIRGDYGFEFLDVKAGRYLLQASDIVVDKTTGAGLEWTSKPYDIDLRNGDVVTGVKLELTPPPGLARIVDIVSHHDIVDHVKVGKDRWGHPDMNGSIVLAFDPRDVPQAPDDQKNTRLQGTWDQTTPEVGSGVHVRVKVQARLRESAPGSTLPFDGAAICDIWIWFFDSGEGELNALIEEHDIVLELGQSYTKTYNEESDDWVSEAASGSVTITNQISALP